VDKGTTRFFSRESRKDDFNIDFYLYIYLVWFELIISDLAKYQKLKKKARLGCVRVCNDGERRG